MIDRVAALGPDAAPDVAGNGILSALIAVTGSADRVVTVADGTGAREHGVRFSSGDQGRADNAIAQVARLLAGGGSRCGAGRCLLSRESPTHTARWKPGRRRGRSCWRCRGEISTRVGVRIVSTVCV
jgi:hypothetical protein